MNERSKKMAILQAVIGANYGDEGKGLMTDYLCARALEQSCSCIVVCTNGGAQRGHTVETDEGERFVFHHMGSGSLLNADTYFHSDFILNPIMFRRDHESFIRLRANADRYPGFFADPRCRFSTPYDMIANQFFEDLRGSQRHGSVGAGIWETVRRYEKGAGISIGELLRLDPGARAEHLRSVRAYTEARCIKKAGITPASFSAWKDIWASELLIENYLNDVAYMEKLVELKSVRSLAKYDIIIAENAQGVLLTQDRYNGSNHTTPSDTGAKQLRRMLDDGMKEFITETQFHYVSRSYITKHGAGDFPGECCKEDICPGMSDLTNVPNGYQGCLRYGLQTSEELIGNIITDMADFRNASPHSVTLTITHLNEYLPDIGAIKALCIKNGFGLLTSDGRTRSSIKQAEL